MAKTNLKQYFPMIRTRQEIVAEISGNTHLTKLFACWEPRRQEEFLNFCSGAKGCKVLYDTFFKQVMDPNRYPDRLETFLSLLLHKKVKIVSVFSNESRIAAEDSLLIMDILVKMEDGSLANVEMQKQGYKFPGQRTACYSADLLLRQYQRVKSEKREQGQKFTYRDIKKVYTIVLFEHSPAECKALPEQYIHFGRFQFDTGLKIEMPQEFIYIALDIFRIILHNRGIAAGINNDLDAWLTFLCEDDPEIIVELFLRYPYFKLLYEDLYGMCAELEEIMGYFSKELEEIDKNTVQYMIEEMQQDIEVLQKRIDEKQIELCEKIAEIEEKDTKIIEKNAEINEKNVKISEKETQISEKEAQISEKEAQINEREAQISEKDAIILEKIAEIDDLKKKLSEFTNG